MEPILVILAIVTYLGTSAALGFWKLRRPWLGMFLGVIMGPAGWIWLWILEPKAKATRGVAPTPTKLAGIKWTDDEGKTIFPMGG